MKRVKKRLQGVLRTDFNKNLAVLVSGSVVAQAIPIALYPLLTRMYDAAHFGVLALYVSLMSVMAVVITGRYELAVMIPKKDEDSRHLVGLSVTLALVLSFVSLVLLLPLSDVIASDVLKAPAIKNWLYFVPLSAFLWATYQSFMYWANRKKKYKRLAISKIVQTGSTGGVNVVWGIVNAVLSGLIVGRIVGGVLSTLALVYQSLRDTKDFFSGLTFQRMKTLAKTYVNFPKHLIVSHLIGQVNMQLPVLVISSFFGTQLLGYFSIGHQLVVLPTALIASNLGDVFRQEATDRFHTKGRFDDVFISTLKKSSLLGLFPFLVFLFFAPDLFAVFFGEEWRVAGEYSSILSVYTFFSFAITPIDKAALIVGATRYILLLHIIRFILNVSIIGVLYWFEVDIKTYLWCLVGVNLIIYFVELVTCYNFSKPKKTKVQK